LANVVKGIIFVSSTGTTTYLKNKQNKNIIKSNENI
jgi:hypothetical protein